MFKISKLKYFILTGILFFAAFIFLNATESPMLAAEQRSEFQRDPEVEMMGVCPPFFLLDERGEIINPVKNKNSGAPYSPRQTCGRCHDYNKITEAYHFQQGRGEDPTEQQKERVQWALSPGNYGGNWCSPAPLYPYLSPKKNSSPRVMDMTSYTFVKKCGVCHPGGGSAEYDRDGKRYDAYMANPANGLTPGGDNTFDGDYYKANWGRSGVLEADCLICHLAGYNFSARKNQIDNENYRWAAVAGAGFGEISGSVSEGMVPALAYKKELFLPDGKISLNIIKSPRNTACLGCHAQPGYKKRGANFRERTDVHLRADMKCVDCHTTGTSSDDPRNNQKYDHNFGKGDDPGGLVRNDLDDTVVSCDNCHTTGRLGAPIAEHAGLPPSHLEKISCAACHIPQRTVRAAQFIASDAFNPAVRIPSKGKRLWTFYGPDMKNYNHYGYMTMMGYDDKPDFIYKPDYIRYKNKIYPANRVHTAWPAIEAEGKPGLMQPKMGDVYKMWEDFKKDNSLYPDLAKIRDDNKDSIPEINTPGEIDAIINSVALMLKNTKYPMQGKRVLWVMNDRAYSSGSEFKTLPKEEWEASPYGNVHKYSHDIFPARSALGSKGCVDCHSFGSDFFYKNMLVYPFDENTKQVRRKNFEVMGYSASALALTNILQSYIKPLGFWAVIIVFTLIFLHYIVIGPKKGAESASTREVITRFTAGERSAHYGAFVFFSALALTGFSVFFGAEFASETIGWIYLIHFIAGLFLLSVVAVIGALWKKDAVLQNHDIQWLKKAGGYFGRGEGLEADRFNAGQKIYFWFMAAAVFILGVSGILITISGSGSLRMAMRFIHDSTAIIFLITIIVHAYLGILANPGALKAIVRGLVTREWAKKHHPLWIKE